MVTELEQFKERTSIREADQPPHRYRVHGLALSSEFELPELTTRRLAAGSQPDVHIRLGAIARPEGLSPSELQIVGLPCGATFLEVSEVAQYLISNGRDIIVAPLDGADFALVRAHLLGWALAQICHHRGFLALHASAVKFGDQVVAFMGDSGAGKSTLAAHCLRAGARLVADDFLRVSLTRPGPPLAFSGMPQLKLWRHALDGLGQTCNGIESDYFREDKFLVPVADTGAEQELPLTRIYVLEQDETAGEGVFERLTGATAITALISNSAGWIRSLDITGRRAGHFKNCQQVVNSAEIVRLKRRCDPALLPATAARIAAQFQLGR